MHPSEVGWPILSCPWHWLKRGNTAAGFCKHKEALTWLCNLLHVLCEKPQAEDLFYFIDCAGSPLLHRLFSSCSEPGAALCNGSVWACRCGWWPCCRAWNPGCLGLSSFKLWNTDSVWQTGLVAPWHGGSSQTRAQMSPALAGRFFITEPPGKPFRLIFKLSQEAEINVAPFWSNTSSTQASKDI